MKLPQAASGWFSCANKDSWPTEDRTSCLRWRSYPTGPTKSRRVLRNQPSEYRKRRVREWYSLGPNFSRPSTRCRGRSRPEPSDEGSTREQECRKKGFSGEDCADKKYGSGD